MSVDNLPFFAPEGGADEEERACGVIASSAGNHAQGVALAAKAFGVPATIVMPAGAPLSKVPTIAEAFLCISAVTWV